MKTTLVAGHLLIGSHSQNASARFSLLSTMCKRSKVSACFLCIHAWPQCVPWELVKTNLPLAGQSVMGSGASFRKVTCLNRDSRGAAWKVFPLEGLSLACSLCLLGSELPALALSSEPPSIVHLPGGRWWEIWNPGPKAEDKAHFRL